MGYLRCGFFEFAFFFQLLFVTLQVLDHKILSGKLEVVSVMVNLLLLLQMEVIKDFVN